MSSFSEKYQRELYESLVYTVSTDMYRFAARRSGSRQVAEELVQETFYEAWRSIDTLRDPSRGKAWLFQILRRRYARWLDHHKQTQHHIVETSEFNESSDPDEKAVESNVHTQFEQRDLLQRGLEHLEEHYKEPFLLVFLAGFSCQEVADELKIPLGTVLSRIHRARQYLRLFLQAPATEEKKKIPLSSSEQGNVVQLSRVQQEPKR